MYCKSLFTQISKELKLPIIQTELEKVSKAYNFPLRRKALGQINIKTPDQAKEVIQWATRHKIELIGQGGNTNLVESATPTEKLQTQLTMIVSPSNKSIEICPQSKTIQVGAGTTLEEAQNTAFRFGLRLPVNYGSKGTATIGGGIATRAMGMGKGFPQIVKSLTIVDGIGNEHTLNYALPPKIYNSVLPGQNNAWPFANQGFLGLITNATLLLESANKQSETLFIGTNNYENYERILNNLEQIFVRIGFEAKIQIAEFMYPKTMENVFKELKYPLEREGHKIFGLIKMGTHLSETSGKLRNILIDNFEHIFQDAHNQTDVVLANSQKEKSQLFQLRESVSDAARHYCIQHNHTAIPMDISCPIESTKEILHKLDHITFPHRQHVFGHLRQGDQTQAAIHYNLAASLNKSESTQLEKKIFRFLYQHYPNISHSAEHGGLGTKNLDLTIEFTPRDQLVYFQKQCQLYNPNNILQSERLLLFNKLLVNKLNKL